MATGVARHGALTRDPTVGSVDISRVDFSSRVMELPFCSVWLEFGFWRCSADFNGNSRGVDCCHVFKRYSKIEYEIPD